MNLAALAPGADERPVGIAQRSASERWNRLKSQYDVKVTPVKSPRPEQQQAVPPVAPEVNRNADEFQAVPAVEAAPAAETVPAKPAPAPVKSKADDAEFRLPVPVSPDQDEPEGPTAAEIPSRPEEGDTSSKVVRKRVPYEENDVKTPTEPRELIPGIRRPLPVPGGPPLKPTQIRKMSDIAPLNDFSKDTEIQRFAAEKAREINVRFGGDDYKAREFPEVVMPWSAPLSKYYPLYFQDPALERYGHTHHPLLQPVISSARVSGQLVMMPYQMALNPPWELRSPLGWYRPGDVAPKLRYPFPWNTEAAAIQAASVVGFIYLIP